MINNLISQAHNYVMKNIPDADQMYNKAMNDIKDNATPQAMLNALLGIAKAKGGYDNVVNHKYYPVLENICKQDKNNVVNYAHSTAKELGVMGMITNFLGNQKQP